MDIDPEVQQYLKAARESTQHLVDLGVEGARKLSRAQEVQFAWDPQVEVDVKDISIPAGEGHHIPARVYTPKDDGASQTSDLPVLMWIHGGGWVLGWVDSLDVNSVCRYLAATSNCLVISVGYRLAPEHKFPAPVEDCYDALRWIAKNARDLGGDPSRLAVAGESAGGNLTAAVALLARDRGGPKIILQVPIYPIADRDFQTESYRLYGRGFGLDTEDMAWFWDQYLKEREDALDPYAAPLRAADLRGLAPALIVTAELDVLRDEAEDYAARLKAADVPTRLWRVEGKPHGFISLPFGGRERADLAREFRSAFSSARGSPNPSTEASSISQEGSGR